MKSKDLRSMSTQDLNSKLTELKTEMIKHNAQISTGTTPKSPGQIKTTKKTIAKILTILEDKTPKLEEQKSSSSTKKQSVEEDKTPKEGKPSEKVSDKKTEETING